MHRIRKMTFATAIAAALILAAPGGRAAGPDIAEVAPLAALTPKAITLGRLLANPLVPALLVSSLQQNLTTSYGRLRSDKPLFWAIRGDAPVPVLPCAEGIAQFTLNHPGSTRGPDGSVHLLAAEGRPDEMVVVFAPDGYAAFALNADDARAALDATARARGRNATISGDPLVRVNLGEAAFAAASAATASVGTNRTDVAAQVAGLSAAISLDDSGISIAADVLPKPGVTPEELCANLEKSLGASLKSFGASEGVKPATRFTPVAGKAQVKISLSAAEMKKAGKAFNAAVVQALATEKKGK